MDKKDRKSLDTVPLRDENLHTTQTQNKYITEGYPAQEFLTVGTWKERKP